MRRHDCGSTIVTVADIGVFLVAIVDMVVVFVVVVIEQIEIDRFVVVVVVVRTAVYAKTVVV